MADLEHGDLFLGLEEVFPVDGAVGMEELIGDVGQDGGTGRGDAALGDEDEEQGEELVDVEGGIDLGEFREEVGGEVEGIIGRLPAARRRWQHSRLSGEGKDPDGNRRRISGSVCRWEICAGNGPLLARVAGMSHF